jgi:hypothetical protein
VTGSAVLAGSPVLSCSPEELRSAARQLHAASSHVEELAGRVRTAAVDPGGWSGVAALEMQAAVESTERLLRVLAGPGAEAAGMLERCALTAEDALEQVRRWGREVDDALAELGRLRAVGPPPEPLLLGVWQGRVQLLEAAVDHARAQLRRTEEELADAQRRAAAVLETLWSAAQGALGQLRVLNDLRSKAGAVVRHGRRAVVSTVGLVALAHLRWDRSEELRQAAQARLDRSVARTWSTQQAAAEKLQRASGVLAPARRLLARASAVGGWAVAVQDVRTGADHDGWRAGVTRVLAAGAVVGMPAAVLLVGSPVGLVAVGAVSAYHLWTAGGWLYDHRARVVPAVRWAGRQVAAGASRVDEWARQARGIEQRARERAGRGLRQLRDRATSAAEGLLGGLPGMPRTDGAVP